MSKLRSGDKLERGTKFLLGCRNARIVGALASRGFTKEDLAEGWRLLQDAARARFDVPAHPLKDGSSLAALDDWENTYFQIAEATLENRFTQAHDRLFLNLSRMEGPAVVQSVTTFLDRLAKMGDGSGEYGKDAKEARKLLEKRGITAAAVEKAKALLADLASIAPSNDPPDLEAQRKESEASEEKFWAWYLEWSKLARTCISDRRMLRELGFLASHHADDALPDGPTAPAPPPDPTTTPN